jgi:hypothetical protein
MNQPRIVRILASVRLASGRSPGHDYELVHAVVRSSPDSEETRESVLLRRVRDGSSLEEHALEIDVQDLAGFHSNWTRFLTDVLWRRAEAGDDDSHAALKKIQSSGAPAPAAPPAQAPPVISASGGRFGDRAKKSELVFQSSMGSKKASGSPPAPTQPSPLSPEKPDAFAIPEDFQVVGFNLSSPPTVDGILRLLEAQPGCLVVVAQKTVAERAEEYIRRRQSGVVKGEPDSFSPIVVERTKQRIPAAQKKFRSSLAGGLARAAGDLNSAVWIPPL